VDLQISKLHRTVFLLLCLTINTFVGLGQEATNSNINQLQIEKKHFLSINPIKPFIGLPNLHYEYQLRSGIGITAFSEILAYEVIRDFEHPDMVNTFGISFYPFLRDKVINQGWFVNINASYILYFRESDRVNSFANGLQLGHKWLFENNIFIEPKILINYSYQNKALLPGFEILVGFRF